MSELKLRPPNSQGKSFLQGLKLISAGVVTWELEAPTS
jgi:hypothetical protein